MRSSQSELELEEDAEFYIIGDRVLVDGHRKGSVAHFGEVDFGSGDWVGVVLDEPTGNHGGKLHGRQYFQCAPKHGLFVRPSRVSRLTSDSAFASASSSRNSTPLGHSSRLSTRPPSHLSTDSSLMDSYFYDDDYRIPSVASLARRLRSIEELSGTPVEPLQQQRRHQQPVGILKKGDRQRPNSQISNRAPDRRSVFNFRPKRTSLEDFESHQHHYSRQPRLDLSQEPARVGDRVLVQTELGELPATLRYLGETDFATSEWAGVELEEPDGKNDGSILGQRYFYCPQNHGLFVPASRVRKLNPHDKIRLLKSTIWSPPPVYRATRSPVSPLETEDKLTSLRSSLLTPATFENETNLEKDCSQSDDIHRPTASLDGKQSSRSRVPKYDDLDLEIELKKSLDRTDKLNRPNNCECWQSNPKTLKSVRYTFSSSKYDGNPIARRTVEYV